MVDVVAGKAVETVVTKVTENAVDSVWRQVGYIRNYKSNIRDLENQLRMLKAERENMKHNMDEATREGEIVEQTATIWFENADAAIRAADDLLAEHRAANKSCLMGYCPNLMTRHYFSRKTMKDTMPALAKVQQDRATVHRISHPMDVQQLESPTDYEALGSRMEILEEIFKALKSTDVNLVGVYGFSGVGKSTLVKQQLVAHVKEKNIFKVVAVANVTHSWDLRKIQQEIADWLGLKFIRGSTESRAAQLHARLKKEKVLIILDDIWEKLPLVEIGIPPNRKDDQGCKIIMTSRDLNVLLKMGVHKPFHLQALEQEEVWQLFETKAGDFKNPRIRPIANEVAKRCLGLPVLIVAVATSLRDKELYEWIDALKHLREFDHKEMDDKVYSALELSYSYLEADAKSLLTLYAQLPCSMLISDLVKFAMGLDLFHNCKAVTAVRNRLLKVVNDLKNSCLLLEDVNELHVRIHDVVHSFVAKLASKEHHVFTLPSKNVLEEWPEEHKLEHLTTISLPYCKIPKLPEVLECPELESFLLLNDDLSLRMSKNFFSRTKKLKLVGLLVGNILPALPSSLGFLKNLQTLCLHGCVLKGTRTIGELKKLRVLSFNSSNIVRLPMEIRNLTRLQILDVSRCEQLEVVPPGILNCLTKLEELCMLGTLVYWESEELKNASLSELKSLPNLINLEIHITDGTMVPADLFHKKLERFRIFIGGGWYSSGEHIPSKLLKLNLNSGAELERVKFLLGETENLHLDDVKGVKNVVPQLEKRGFPELKELFVQRCNEMELIVDDERVGGVNTFSSSSFSNLKKLRVANCNALRYLCSFSTFRNLTQLQELEVSYCQNLEMIVGFEDEDDNSDDAIIKLTHLMKLSLQDLPRLACFCSPIANEVYGEIARAVEFDSLFTAKIQLSNLTELRFSSLYVEKIWHNNSLEFCLYGKLTSLVVDGCGNLSHGLTSSMVRNLSQLETLEICNCKSIKEVVSTDGEIEEKTTFPELIVLKMKGLPRVVKFCSSNLLQCPSLETLYIENCPRLQRFLSTSNEDGQQDSTLFDEKVEFPNLEDLMIVGVNKLDGLWGNKLRGDSFNKLKYLKVRDAKKIVRIFPPNLLKKFKYLEALDIRHCKSIKEVFDIKALIAFKERGGIVVTELKKLWVYDTPNLLHVWNDDPNGVLDYANLSFVDIDGCSSLKCVFPASVARGLVHLEKLYIWDSEILHIIAPDKEENEGAAVFTFHRLKRIDLRRLRQIERLCAGTHITKLPALKTVIVTECSKLQQPSLLYKTAIPSMERLVLNGKEVSMIRKGELAVDMFHKLKFVELNFYDDSSVVFPFDLFHIFHNLGTLRVVSSKLVELFPLEGPDVNHENQCRTVLRKIHSLDLHVLPNLKTFWNEVLESLESLYVRECDSLVILAPSSACFPHLTSLEVYKCKGLVSLVTSSTAKSLLRLKTLTVSKCNELKAIVSDDEKATYKIFFLKLQTLEFYHLSRLSSFCSGNHSFRFPSLEKVLIERCPNMEFFSKGVLTTPILQRVQSTEEDDSGYWLGNLNSTVSFMHEKAVGLCGLRHLKVSEHPNLKNRWNSEVPVEFLNKLESLVVDEIAISSYAVPSNSLEFLNQLEKLEVSNSEVLEEVFDVQMGLGAYYGGTDLLSFLESIHLINLPRLRNIWNVQPQGTLNFKRLNSLKVHHCSSLKMILTPSVAEGLVQLQEIEVQYCDSVEEIISKGAGSEVKSEIIFLTLRSIKLESLPALVSLNGGSRVLKCPSLERIEIADCPGTFTHAFLRWLQSNASEQTTEPTIQLPNLTELKFSSIYLEKIWHNNSLEFSLYGKLTSLVVDGCGNLSYALTSSMVRNLAQLETLEICNCKSIEEVVSTKGETEEKMAFPELNFLKMKGLPTLVKFCTGNLLQCPSLETLYIENCPRLQRFLSTSNEAGQQGSTLFDEKVEFPNLEDLEIIGVNGLEGLWDNELRENSFNKLKYLNVIDAKKIVRIFPPNQLRTFKDLETLEIDGCDAIREVFDVKALIDLKERGDVLVTQLKKLWVYNNPNLLHVWNEDPNGIIEFANLSLVDIDGCSSLQCVFPASVARGLVHLEELYIWDSGILHIIGPDQEEIEGPAVFKFFMLKQVNFRRLPQLERLCAGINTTEWPALKTLFVTEFSKLQQPALLFKMAIPRLEDLALNGKEVLMIREGQLAVDMFHNLTYLELNFYDDSSAVFPFDLFHIFHNLETLSVAHCKFVELFPSEGLDVSHENQCRTVLKKIHSLELDALPNLKTFWNEVLESLESLDVRECDSLFTLAPSSASFQNLTSLEVYKCIGLVSLVAFSTAKSLLRLESLKVRECHELKGIVFDDDEREMTTGEIIFLKLESLKLDSLSSLSSFCCRNHNFRFPSLEEVIIKQCPNMEFFSKGTATAPELLRVRLTEEEDSGYWLGNLNSTVSFLRKKTVGKPNFMYKCTIASDASFDEFPLKKQLLLWKIFKESDALSQLRHLINNQS